MSDMENTEQQQPIKRGRGRPPLTDEQRVQRDKKRYEKQHKYYIENKERIAEQQKQVKNQKYASDPEFRKKAIEYICKYNKRRTAICNFVDEYKDEAFQKALQAYLEKNQN
jgi:hypothetical protein